MKKLLKLTIILSLFTLSLNLYCPPAEALPTTSRYDYSSSIFKNAKQRITDAINKGKNTYRSLTTSSTHPIKKIAAGTVAVTHGVTHLAIYQPAEALAIGSFRAVEAGNESARSVKKYLAPSGSSKLRKYSANAAAATVGVGRTLTHPLFALKDTIKESYTGVPTRGYTQPTAPITYGRPKTSDTETIINPNYDDPNKDILTASQLSKINK